MDQRLRRLDDKRYESIRQELTLIATALRDLSGKLEDHIRLEGHPAGLTRLRSLERQLEAVLDALSPLTADDTPRALAEMAHSYRNTAQIHLALVVVVRHYFGWMRVFKKPMTWLVMTALAALIGALVWALVRIATTPPVHP